MGFDSAVELATLTILEIILGVDNVVFIALIIQYLPDAQKRLVRFIGISLALMLRVVLLFAASSIVKLVHPIYSIYSFDISWRDILLFVGGLFLVVKALHEIYIMFMEKKRSLSGDADQDTNVKRSLSSAIMQIIFVDFVMSFDSILTAVAITSHLSLMVCAVTIAMIVMLFAVKPIGDFIEKYPSVKVIAICFVILIGVYLLLQGMHIEISRGYLYVAILFSLSIETINIMLGIVNRDK